VVVANGTATLATGDGATASVPVGDGEEVSLTAFVDFGPRGGFSYGLAMPVERTDGGLRALTPAVEFCRSVDGCGPGAAYVPSAVPEGVSVTVDVVAGERND
jgi:hypothetical protein